MTRREKGKGEADIPETPDRYADSERETYSGQKSNGEVFCRGWQMPASHAGAMDENKAQRDSAEV